MKVISKTTDKMMNKIYMFGTNSVCNQRPKAGYET